MGTLRAVKLGATVAPWRAASTPRYTASAASAPTCSASVPGRAAGHADQRRRRAPAQPHLHGGAGVHARLPALRVPALPRSGRHRYPQQPARVPAVRHRGRLLVHPVDRRGGRHRPQRVPGRTLPVLLHRPYPGRRRLVGDQARGSRYLPARDPGEVRRPAAGSRPPPEPALRHQQHLLRRRPPVHGRVPRRRPQPQRTVGAGGVRRRTRRRLAHLRRPELLQHPSPVLPLEGPGGEPRHPPSGQPRLRRGRAGQHRHPRRRQGRRRARDPGRRQRLPLLRLRPRRRREVPGTPGLARRADVGGGERRHRGGGTVSAAGGHGRSAPSPAPCTTGA